MKIFFNRAIFFVLFSVFFLSCTNKKDETLEKFGNDSYYFQALQCLNQKKEQNAVSLLKKGIRKSNPFFAELCYDKLASIGTVRERITTSTKYYADFPSEKSLLRLIQELTTGEEYEKIINLTTNLNDKTNAEIFYLRLNAIAKKNRTDFSGEIEDWFLHFPITHFHFSFFEKYKNDYIAKLLTQETIDSINFRIKVFKKDYSEAYKQLSQILNQQTNPAKWIAELPSIMIVDIEKTFVNGSISYINNAQICDAAIQIVKNMDNKNTQSALYLLSGMLYNKSSAINIETALNRFLYAIETAQNISAYERALWYYFSATLKTTTKETIDALQQYGFKITNKSFFSDFFNTLAQRLLSNSQWQDFYTIYQIIKDFADPETISKYAYISARILQEDFLKIENLSLTEKNTLISNLFEAAYIPGGSFYYKSLAAYHLKKTSDEIRENFYNVELIENFSPNHDYELLMKGFAAFQLPEYLFSEWNKCKNFISLQTELEVAQYLTSLDSHLYSSQALRILSNAIYHADIQPSEDVFRIAYPRLFAQEIYNVCNEFKLDENIFLGLVRSESFFAPAINSHKGAVGLAQLMPTTAMEIARKLKITEYDLTDSKTNLRFGAYYLEEMHRRSGYKMLEALFAYNAGLKRVQNWKKNVGNIPSDIFLEIIPIEETREYGRKVTTAAVFYGTLYYGKDLSQIIDSIISF